MDHHAAEAIVLDIPSNKHYTSRMSAAAPPATPTGLMPRFSQLMEKMKRGLLEGADRLRRGPFGPPAAPPLVVDRLWHYLYLSRIRNRLMGLHTRFAAGKLPAAPRRCAAPRPAAERQKSAPRPPRLRIPPGQVFAPYGVWVFAGELRALLEDPEMRALLAAAPQAGRLLRPLWRKLSTDPLPEMLGLPAKPPKPPRPPRPRQPYAARPKPARVASAKSPAPLPEAPTLWEPTPCYPPWGEPPPPKPAPAVERLPAPRPPAMRPPAWGRPAPTPKPTISPPPWLRLLFQR